MGVTDRITLAVGEVAPGEGEVPRLPAFQELPATLLLLQLALTKYSEDINYLQGDLGSHCLSLKLN